MFLETSTNRRLKGVTNISCQIVVELFSLKKKKNPQIIQLYTQPRPFPQNDNEALLLMFEYRA